MKNKFKYRIRDLRREMNVSGEQLGKIVNVGKTTISQWENGINYPNQETLEKLCNYFNVSLDYLMGRTDIKNPNHNINNITKDDFTVAFSNLQGNLTEEDKRQILKMAQFLAEENKNNKK